MYVPLRLILLSTLGLSLGCSTMFGAGSGGSGVSGEETSGNEESPWGSDSSGGRGIPPYHFTTCDAYSNPVESPSDLHVDINNGNDTTGDGTAGNPFASIDHVISVLPEGGTAVLHEGDYGDVTVGIESCEAYGGLCPKTMFSDWTTVRGAVGETVTLDHLTVGSENCPFRENGCSNGYVVDEGEGLAQIYMRFQGLHFKEGVDIRGSHHIEIVDSKMEIPGPWNGSKAAIDRAAVHLKFASDVLFACNEVTNSGWGVAVTNNTNRNVFRNNYIHGISQDGFVVMSASDALFEGNVIHNLDDGCDDDEVPCGDGVGDDDWNRHCDGFQLYPMPPEAITPHEHFLLHNITIRGNIIYDNDGMGIMLNTKPYPGIDTQYFNITIENNIIGKGRGAAIHASKSFDGLIIRNNTIITLEGHGFQSLYRWLETGSSAEVLLPSASHTVAGVEIYNNIFDEWPQAGGIANYDRMDHNMIYGGGASWTGLGLGSIKVSEPPFLNRTSFDGILAAGSLAINAGTQLDATFYNLDIPILPYDVYGTARDEKPDIGAYEVPDLRPSSESFPMAEPPDPQFYVDDFERAFLMASDPFLNSADRAPLTWGSVSGYQMFQVQYQGDRGSNWLIPADCASGSRFVVSDQLFSDSRVSFEMTTSHNNGGESSVFLYQDTNNYYMLDLSGGQFIRRMNGSNTVLSSAAGLQVSNIYSGDPLHDVEVNVYPSPSGIQFIVKIDGSQVASYTDTNGTALSRFTEGKIGFTRQNSEGCHIASYDNVVVEKL